MGQPDSPDEGNQDDQAQGQHAFGQDLTEQDQPMLAGDEDNLFIFAQLVF